MPHGATTLLLEKLAAVAIDIESIERLINTEPLDTSDQLLALRTIQELYRRLPTTCVLPSLSSSETRNDAKRRAVRAFRTKAHSCGETA